MSNYKISIEDFVDSLFVSEESSDKKWMQKEAQREEDKDTKGSLREYFGLKEDEHITITMIDKELNKLKNKYPEGNYPKNILKLIRRLNLAKTYISKSK